MTNFAVASNETEVINVHTDSIATHDYFKSVTKLALSKIDNADDYDVKYYITDITQGRIIEELKREGGLVDLYPTGASKKREEELIPIRIPLFKGTLGYRLGHIHKDNKTKFENIKTLEDLRKVVACQGAHWPDSDILEYAKLPVLRNDNYKSMFFQTARKYYDYFPRAIIEAYVELEAHGLEESDVMVFEKLLVMYPFPMYFFCITTP